ncbi:DUF2804 domain-containing protein [bacterium]|nr:DUF2804 domain-containing protein [bacterium]MBU1063202.1 DUF2804 domain-containing protein [bacterium]MBU1635587.1 DUF2804 domain-containing protein [bacterium]MBU1873745.1 DUF2804 domain-containing protein [bacterium]
MQHEITEKSPLLNSGGSLNNPGWARDLLPEYNRNDIKAPKFRIKEWDYYCILKDNGGVSLTIADNGYMGFIAATVFDFDKPEEISGDLITPFPLGKFKLPPTSKSGDIIFENKRLSMKFLRQKESRTIEFDFSNFKGNHSLKGKISLHQPDSYESMVIATPFPKNKHAFYYNQKVNCMPATGSVTLGNRKIEFRPETSFGVLDWGRGVWTYNNTWYWGSASGKVNGDLFGFNISYGFGDTSQATENMLFLNGKAHKLDRVEFHIPADSYLKPWTFSSNDGRFDMDFQPILDRYSNTNLFLLQSDQHQVFGRFSGKAILNDGQEIIIRDFLGFAEKVMNRW